jgi:hypothetical protein
MATLKVIEKPKVFKETGSAFDCTELDKIKTRAGGHEIIPKRNIDVSAFSFSKVIAKPDTR